MTKTYRVLLNLRCCNKIVTDYYPDVYVVDGATSCTNLLEEEYYAEAENIKVLKEN